MKSTKTTDSGDSVASKDDCTPGEEVHPPLVRNLILRAMCGVYLVAFLSFYVQAEGKQFLDFCFSPNLPRAGRQNIDSWDRRETSKAIVTCVSGKRYACVCFCFAPCPARAATIGARESERDSIFGLGFLRERRDWTYRWMFLFYARDEQFLFYLWEQTYS